jgi:ribosome-associated protein
MPAPILVDDRVYVPENAVQVTTSRSSGPGGQNTNKVASKVDVRVDLDAVVGLDEQARVRLLARAARYLDADGRLYVTSQRTRDQGRNLEDAYEKIRTLITAAMIKPKPRRPTKPGRAAVQRRLKEKRHTAERKQRRSRQGED